jgi:ribosomal protein S18 acetylase RimI-like enzyme
MADDPALRIRNTEPRDFAGIGDLCRRVYPEDAPWSPAQLGSHLRVFPEGQFVATLGPEECVVGMASSLIVHWDNYDMFDDWDAFTAHGALTNHDPTHGHTLYGVEIIVDPTMRGHGLGHKMIAAEKGLAQQRKLRRMRGGARMRDYHTYAAHLKAADYVIKVVHGEILDHTLTFHLHEGFHILAVLPHYLSNDSETLGYAALVEWLNPETVKPEHYAARPTRYLHRDVVARDHADRRSPIADR